MACIAMAENDLRLLAGRKLPCFTGTFHSISWRSRGRGSECLVLYFYIFIFFIFFYIFIIFFFIFLYFFLYLGVVEFSRRLIHNNPVNAPVQRL